MSTPQKPTTTVPMGQAAPPSQKTTNGQAVSSMVCGIVSFFFFGIILGPIAICLGVSAKNSIKENPETMDGECQATSGIIMGSIAVVLWIIGIIVIFGSSA